MLKTKYIYIGSLYFALIILSGVWYWPITRELNPNFNIKIFGTLSDNTLFIIMALTATIGVIKNGIQKLFDIRVTLLILLVFVSSMLSNNVVDSFKTFLRLFIFFSYITILVRTLNPEEITKSLLQFFKLFIFINSLSLLFLPHISFMEGLHDGAARGLLNHKNSFGFLTLISLAFVYTSEQKNIIKYTLIIIATIMIILSKSTTSIILMILLLILIFYINIGRKINKTTLFFFMLVILGLFSFTYTWILTEIFNITEKSNDFSNRTMLWSYYYNIALEKLYFGQGNYILTQDFWNRFNFYSGIEGNYSAHNSYLSTFVSYGLIITILYITSLMMSLIFLLRLKFEKTSYPIYLCVPLIMIRGFFESGAMLSVNIYILLLSIIWLIETRNFKIGKKWH
ncbi:hypothetical protein DN062_08425 [Nitrincola tibetensis]|uniref:O-antigen ligase-related domain-containing protein n=1 Tax=Nitrincola tibetensis TaxID=2219697 RepID=A0A364NMM7_9GAMM|nr:O-antigen ligase family protein [Nitrincola tibetensis]RAU18250.1 hypothetical protein DN062_08425 [Nitrincola tibetensis]